MKSVYLIRDNVSGQYSPLFVEPNQKAGQRQFASFLSGIQGSPADYDLYQLGHLVDDDPDTCPHLLAGSLSENTLRHIINGLALNPAITKDDNDE